MQEQIVGGKRPASYSTLAWTAMLVAGVVLALVGQFLLDSFADASAIGHWTQHALLFWSGTMVAAGTLRLYQLGSRSD